MSKKVTPAAFAYLEKRHGNYCDYNQKESSTYRRMAETGHPFAENYSKLRAFFDELKYACNSNARFYSFKSQSECSEYWAPKLSLSSYPSGERFSEFGHIYPARDNWKQYIEAAAEAGYPPETGPKFEGGSWIITTQFGELVDILTSLGKAGKIPHVSTRVGEDERATSFHISIYTDTNNYPMAMHNRIVTAINKFHRGYILPKRTPELTAQDNAPLPLEQKKFMLANVKHVTVNDRQVLVPLIPMGPDTTVLQEAVNDLAILLNQGYPFENVRDWLQKFLKKESFDKLEAEFAVTA